MENLSHKVLDETADKFTPKFQQGDIVRLVNRSKTWNLRIMDHLDNSVQMVQKSSYCDPINGFVFQIKDKKSSILFTIKDSDADFAQNEIEQLQKEDFLNNLDLTKFIGRSFIINKNTPKSTIYTLNGGTISTRIIEYIFSDAEHICDDIVSMFDGKQIEYVIFNINSAFSEIHSSVKIKIPFSCCKFVFNNDQDRLEAFTPIIQKTKIDIGL